LKAVEVSAENLIVEVGYQQTTNHPTMNKLTDKAVVGLSESGLGLDELVRHGAGRCAFEGIRRCASAVSADFPPLDLEPMSAPTVFVSGDLTRQE
jgi:hypothetical protein